MGANQIVAPEERYLADPGRPNVEAEVPSAGKALLKCRDFAIYCACQTTAEETSASTSHCGENAKRQLYLRPLFIPRDAAATTLLNSYKSRKDFKRRAKI
jgi:hypothetical protein